MDPGVNIKISHQKFSHGSPNTSGKFTVHVGVVILSCAGATFHNLGLSSHTKAHLVEVKVCVARIICHGMEENAHSPTLGLIWT